MRGSTEDVHLSRLVDGELDSDESNAVLLEVLDDGEARGRLKELLTLRCALAPWRQQVGPSPSRAATPRPSARVDRSMLRYAGSLAVAAAIGGLLVMGGFLMARHPGGGTTTAPPADSWASPRLPAEAIMQTARAFALHESVGGPLKWYAHDDRSVQLASINGGSVDAVPVALFVRVGSATRPKQPVWNHVVVCRVGEAATVTFPAGTEDRPDVRVQVVADRLGDGVNVRYGVAIDAPGDASTRWGSLVGQHSVGTAETPIGQLDLGNGRGRVAVSACRLPVSING